jgi:AraC family transcriptional regulator, regulatory protein of adaptative response / DNA-3-methyladenine glycosylase II
MGGARPGPRYDVGMLPKPMSWDRIVAREGRFDGKFIVGVLSTGIYCLPSCTARPPKPENVRVLKTEAQALAAGLRPCKRCRPDLFYRGEDADVALFEGLAQRVRAAPATFADAPALARACGVSQTKLGELMRGHAHLTPAAWLKRERVQAAARLLLSTERRVVDVGHAAGFESESAFHRQFLAATRMTPGAYRGLNGASVFMLHLPAGYRAQEVLAYHARDPASPCERVDGTRLLKALTLEETAVVLEISLEREAAWCRIHARNELDRTSAALAHSAALRMLGLTHDVAAFETRAARHPRMAALLARRRGLRLPLTPSGFEGLSWAIIGQQINVSFASTLRRELLELAGERIGDMCAHPTAAQVAALDVRDLRKRRFSRSKAEYLIGAAQAIVARALDPDTMVEGSAVAAEHNLTKVRGIGTWTARYMLMRGAGFADCAPVGDVALAAALQKLNACAARPEPKEVEALMLPFAPHRSLATCHLWASLRDAA